MTTLAWFHCFAGIAGDMAMASLVDAGADLDAVSALIKRVPVSGWSIEAEPVLRAGVAATRLHVHAEDTPVVRTYAHISGLIDVEVLRQLCGAQHYDGQRSGENGVQSDGGRGPVGVPSGVGRGADPAAIADKPAANSDAAPDRVKTQGTGNGVQPSSYVPLAAAHA